jgi:MSHA biogenesis protein MshO
LAVQHLQGKLLMMRIVKQRGFSLVEIVVAIVIMSIISIGLVDFITNSASGYVQSATRNQISASGRVVLDRVVMDLHNALSESVRISSPLSVTQANNGEGFAGDQCLEFIRVRAATTYIDPAFRPATHKAAFDVVDFVPAQVGVNGVYAAIYPTSAAQLYDAPFGDANATEAIARVNVTNGVDANTDTLTYSRLSDNAAYNHRFRRQSSVDRIFLTDQPVSYCISGSKLFRYSDYGFTEDQMLPLEPGGDCTAGLVTECLPAATPDRVLITDQLDNSAFTGGVAGQTFDQVAASRHRNAVIQLEMNFSQDGESVRLNHEVLLQISP